MTFEEGPWQRWYVKGKRSRVVSRGCSGLEELQGQRCGGGNEAGMLRGQRRVHLRTDRVKVRVCMSLDVWLQHE